MAGMNCCKRGERARLIYAIGCPRSASIPVQPVGVREPGLLQVQRALQAAACRVADVVPVVEALEFGLLHRDQVAS